jgi:hypothetical protein
LTDHRIEPDISTLTRRLRYEKIPPEYLEKERHNFWNLHMIRSGLQKWQGYRSK